MAGVGILVNNPGISQSQLPCTSQTEGQESPSPSPIFIDLIKENPKTSDFKLFTAFLDSILAVNPEIVNQTDSNGRTPLMFSQTPQLTEYLIRKGANVNASDKHGSSALMHTKNPAIALKLIKAKADLDACDSMGQTALIHAIHIPGTLTSREDTEEIFLEKNARIELIRLLASETNVNLLDVNQMNSLLHAVYIKDLETAQFLLTKGADVNCVDKHGNNAAMYAISRDDIRMLRLLIDYKVNLNHMNANNKTPFLMAFEMIKINRFLIENQKASAIFKLVLESSDHTFINYQESPKSFTPLILAIKLEKEEIVNSLIDRNVKINQRGPFGASPLIWSVITLQPKLIQLLIDNGADVNLPDDYGRTALIWAFNRNDMLLKEFNVSIKPFHSSLHEIIEILLEADCDVELKDNSGRTVFDYAIVQNDFKCFRLLARYHLASVFFYFSQSTPEIIKADLNRFIYSQYYSLDCRFPLTEIQLRLLEYFASNQNLSNSSEQMIREYCSGLDFLMYFGTVDFQEKILSEVIIRLDEDMIETEPGISLLDRRNRANPDALTDEERHLEQLSQVILEKRLLAKNFQIQTEAMIPLFIQMANIYMKPSTFRTSLSDEFTCTLVNYLKNFSDIRFLKRK